MIGVVVDKQSRLVIALIHDVISSSTTEIVGENAVSRGVDPNQAEILIFDGLDIKVGEVLPEGSNPITPPISDVEQLRMDNASMLLELVQIQSRQDQADSDNAALLLMLAEGGSI
ncbi:hypothetical protein D3C81_1641570 [compost metagenome]